MDCELDELLEKSRALGLELLYEENEALLRRAVQRFPYEAEVWLRLANAVLISTPEQSAGFVRRAISLAPADPFNLTLAASIMLYLQEFDAAQDYAERATRATSQEFAAASDLLRIQGELAAHRNELGLAEELLNRAFSKEPEMVGHGLTLAKFYLGQGRLTEALRVLSLALQYRRGDDALCRLRDEVLSELGHSS
jgi:tetratricopeptide (TPR) repeat protein